MNCDDTARHLLFLLKSGFPTLASHFKVYFVCGLDVLPSVAGVFEGEGAESLGCVCVPREGYSINSDLLKRHPTVVLSSETLPGVSSTHARELIRQNGDTEGILDPRVRRYVAQHKLLKMPDAMC